MKSSDSGDSKSLKRMMRIINTIQYVQSDIQGRILSGLVRTFHHLP